MGFLKTLIEKSWHFLPLDLEARKECKRGKSGFKLNGFSDESHLQETIGWLCRAQDSNADSGVSRAYKATRYIGYGSAGWQARVSYYHPIFVSFH